MSSSQHLALALGELGETGRGLGRGGRRAARELGDDGARDRGREQRRAARHHADGVEQLLRRGVLEHEPAGARAEGVEHVVVEAEGGEHEHPHLVAQRREDPPRGLDPVELRHPDVEHRDVRLARRGRRRPPAGRRRPRRPRSCRTRSRRSCAARREREPGRRPAGPGSRGPAGAAGAARAPRSRRRGAGPWRGRHRTWRRARASRRGRGRPPGPPSAASAPSSAISMSSSLSPYRTVTRARAGPACLSALVSASWTMR